MKWIWLPRSRILTPFLVAMTGSPSKVGAALLEFGEVLDRFHDALRAEEPLDVHAPERRRIDPMAMRLRTDISGKMRRAVGVAVRMTIEAGDAATRFLRTPILGLIELLLRERRQQQTQSFELFGIQNAVEELVIVLDGDQFALGNIAEVRTRGQVDRRRKFRQKMIRDVEIQIEAGEVTPFLLHDLVDFEFWKNHSAFGMVWMRQRIESLRELVLVADFGWAHRRQLVPSHAGGQLDANALLQGLFVATWSRLWRVGCSGRNAH